MMRPVSNTKGCFDEVPLTAENITFLNTHAVPVLYLYFIVEVSSSFALYTSCDWLCEVSSLEETIITVSFIAH